ncbi:MAG: hypothetical protein P8R46_10055 [Planctomycetota bacterium]|nr:hypothetical protein [Planctomycetota bacterium]
MNQTFPALAVAVAALTTAASAQNDECATAATLTVGSVAFDTTSATLSSTPWPCAAGGAPDLWYAFTAPNAASYSFDTCGSSYDTAIEVFDGACGALNPLICNDDSCGLQSSTTLTFNAGDSVFVRVGGYSGSTGAGLITATELLIPPPSGSVAAWLTAVGAGTPATYTNSNLQGPLDDDIGIASGANGMTYEFVAYGSNDGLSNALMGAVNTPTGDSAGLKFEQYANSDQYGITQFGVVDLYYTSGFNAPGTDVHLVFVADTTLGQTELFVDGLSFGTVPYAPILQGMQGIGQIYNPAGAPWDPMDQGRIHGVAVYDGMLTLPEIVAHRDAYFSGSLGTRYCDPGAVNSAGTSGAMGASGSLMTSANSLTIAASDLPLNSFAFFLASQTQGSVSNPGGSQGDLCLGGAIGRYVGPGQIVNSGATGEVTLPLDLTQTPQPTGFVSVQPGETWNFQAWYRDSVGGSATSNFTDGLSITFQ